MWRGRWTALTGILCLCTLLTLGCNDPKDQEIAALQQENQRLTSDLASARMNADTNREDADDAHRRMSELQNRVDELQMLASQQPAQGDGWESVPGGARISLASGILFDSGKAILKNDAKSRLDKVASDILGTYTDKDIFVFGHTDNTPIRKSGWKDNYELSVQRALAIVRHLQSRGIPGERLVAAGCSEFRPTADNSNNENRTRNRRVEIFAIDAQK